MANPLQQAAVRRKVYYFAALIGLFALSILWRGGLFTIPLSDATRSAHLNKLRRLHPLEREYVQERLARGESFEGFDPIPAAPTGINAAADWVRSRTIEEQAAPHALDLRELEQGDPEIAGATARLSLIGARGFVVTALWKLAIDKQKKNEFQDFELLVRAVTRLQPNFITPWIYQSWNIAYNVSVENDRLNDMYFYIARGIELLAEGERLNKNSPDMRYQIAFYYQNKFGVSDKVTTLRCLMQLSCIPPQERDPAKRKFLNDDGSPTAEFRDFCRKNPQLVRRLKDKLKYDQPQAVVQFLEDNQKVPTRFDGTGQLLDPRDQFPILPRAFPEAPNEYHPRSDNLDDVFDAFHAARAWYEYSLTVVPPPNPEPTGVIYLAGENRFKYRIPRSPAMIIFRQGAPRAQSYLAERLTKEGWFDTDTKWYPDERADTESERWFPRGSAGDFGPGEGLVAGTSAFAEWGRAYERWKRHGELNGLSLTPAQLLQYQRDAQGVSDDPSLMERTDEQLKRMQLTREKVRAKQTLRNYQANRSMTNFAYFLASSEADSDKDTMTARAQLWDAERMTAVSKPRAIELYAAAIARWRGVLLQYPNLQYPDGQIRSDRTEEETYEHMLALARLLERGERIETKARQRVEAVRAVAPVVVGPGAEDAVRSALAWEIAEAEAGLMVSAEDARVKRRTEQVTGPLVAATASGAVFGTEGLLSRAVVETDFAWLPEYRSEARDEANLWVTPDTKRLMKERLGLARSAPPAGMTPPSGSHPHPTPAGPGQ